jgi:hypothetical protein
MPENYYALFYCIVKKVVPEVAFRTFNLMPHTKADGRKRGITLDDIKEMYRMKGTGCTYKEIGEAYDKTDQAIHKLMKRSKYLMKEEMG